MYTSMYVCTHVHTCMSQVCSIRSALVFVLHGLCVYLQQFTLPQFMEGYPVVPAVTHTVEDSWNDLRTEVEVNTNRYTPHSESIVRGYRREVRYMHVQWSANRNAQLTDAHPLMDGSVYVPCYCLCTVDLLSIYVAIITVLKTLLGTTKVLVSYVCT